MIQDEAKVLQVFPPNSGQFVKSSLGIDLNPDFGNGQNARKAPLPGQGGEFMFRIEVEASFVAAVGTPIVQIHALLSNALPTAEVHTGSQVIAISTLAPTTVIAGTRVNQGFLISQLVAGNYFFLRVNPWVAELGRTSAGAPVIGKDLRSLGIGITIANFDDAGGPAATGELRAYLVKTGDISRHPEDFIYPAGHSII